MKAKLPLYISLFLNFILAGWVMLLLGTHIGSSSKSFVTVGKETTTGAAERGSDAEVTRRKAKVARYMAFDWHKVESEDYREYLANLRAVGCPEKTIKDIIIADVNDLFTSRIDSVTMTNHYQYWKKEPVSRSEEQEKQIRDLYAQKREVLKALGIDASDYTDLLGEVFRGNLEERNLQLEYLPESKRQQVKEALFQQAQQEVAGGNDLARTEALEQQTLNRIRSMLSPDEFKEYELRTSTDAQQLRAVLDPVVLTEQEFRAVFDAWRSAKNLSPGAAEDREARRVGESTLQQMLGPDRFQLYLSGVKSLGY
jgi:hypothetical protein